MKYVLFFFMVIFIHLGIFSQATLNGTALDLGEGCYQLTTTLNAQNGSVWFNEEINLSEDFDINLVMNFGGNDGGADGIVFVLQNNNLTEQGVGGGELGYGGITNSVAVEFDTWQNGEQGDLSADHIGINSNGVVNHNLGGPVQADANAINIEDGDDHDVRIKWTASTNLIEVFFDCEPRLSVTSDIVANSFGGDNMVYWGFVASTGGANNLQTVCLNSGTGAPITFSTCTGAPVQLNVGDIDPNEPVTWSPEDFLDDPDAVSPISSTTEDIMYTVEYTHVCGYDAVSEVSVIIEELEVSSTNDPSLSCDEELVLIQAETNYPDVNINWSTENGNITLVNGLNIVADEIGQYLIEVDYNGLCFAEYTFDVGIDPFGIDVSFVDPVQLDCFTSEVTLNALVTNPNVTIDWSTEDGNFLSGTDGLSPTVDEPGTYTLSVEIDETCMGTGDVEVFLDDIGIMLNSEETEVITCDNTSTQLGITTNFPDMTFVWDDSDGNIVQNENTLSPYVSEGGDYILTAFIGNCEEELIVTVEEDTQVYQPTIDLTTAPSCIQEGAIEIGFEEDVADVDANTIISWSTNDGELLGDSGQWIQAVGSAGTYTVEVENVNNGCEAEAQVELGEADTFLLQTPQTVQLTCEDPVVNVLAQVENDLSLYTFEWSFGEESLSGEGLNAFTVSEIGLIDLNVTYGECSQALSIPIEQAANYSIDLSSLDAPNVFSPNSDDLNQSFKPVLKTDTSFDVIPFLENYDLKIFNRWGGVIFESSSTGWDGKINGEFAETGAYYYVITFESVCGDESNGELAGSVIILK